MFYFTCNESKIYESFTFLNNLQEKLFNDILIYWAAPVWDKIQQENAQERSLGDIHWDPNV